MILFNKSRAVKFSDREKKFLKILDFLIDNNELIPYEREKLIKARTLYSKGAYFPNVMHRIDIRQ